MGRRKQCVTQERKVVAMFTAQEVQAALYKCYPERYAHVPDQATMWFSFVEGGIAVSVLE